MLVDEDINEDLTSNEKAQKIISLKLNDDILILINTIKYLYFFSDVINLISEKEKINNKHKHDFNEKTDDYYISDFLVHDDSVIYSLILLTDIDYIKNIFLSNIIVNRTSIDLLLKDTNLVFLLKTLFECCFLLHYWHDNLSDDDIIKNEIEVECTTLSFNIKNLIFLLKKLVLESSELKSYCKKLEMILTYKLYSSDNFKEKNIDEQMYLNSYIYDNLRNIFEFIINFINKIKINVKNNFFNVLYNKNHNPHMALLFSFIELTKKMNLKFSEFPDRYFEYYLKGILMFKNRKEKKDIALISCFLKGEKDKILLKKDIKINGGKDKENKDIVFKVTKDTNIGRTKLLTIRTISEYVKISDINSFSEYRISEYSMEEVYKKNQLLNLFSNTVRFDKSFLLSNKNKLGYLIASPLFKNSSGYRKIIISVFPNPDSAYYLKTLIKNINIENELEYDYYCKVLKEAVSLTYSSDTKLVNIPKENVNIRWDNDNYAIVFELSIKQNMPKISAPLNYKTAVNNINQPFVEILASNKTNLWSSILFFNLNFYKINISVDVKDCTDLILQNDVNIIETNFPFQIFGPFPEVGADVYIGNSEVFSKDLSSLKLNIEWDNLPQEGLKKYYRGYRMNTKTSDFIVSVSFLNNNRWEPIDEKNKQKNTLFDCNIDNSGNEIINNTTTIDINVSKLKLNTVKNIDFENKFLSASTISGFLRLKLISPEYGFGYKLYYKLTSESLLLKRIKMVKEFFDKQLNEPFIPVVKKLSLDYSYEKIFVNNGSNSNDCRMFKISPFGYEPVQLIDDIKNKDIRLYIPEDSTINNSIRYSRVYIELSDITLSTITLFFYIDENNISETKHLEYQIGYINNNKFVEFSKNEILINKTDGFTKSGILKLKKPNISGENTYLQSNNKNSLWLEIRFYGEKESMPLILNIYPNPVYVKRTSDNNSVFLNELSLNKIIDDNYSEVSLFQPFHSFSGKKAETDDELYRRISTRLLGKDRCITINDYKNFILENFQEVGDVIEVEDNPEDVKTQGCVNLMVVVNRKIYEQNNNLFIQASNILLSNIKNELKKKCSAFAKINIINPYYEEIKVIVRIVFNKDYDKNEYTAILNKDICNYISPWVFDKNIKISIIKSISVANLLKFIKSQKYVKTVLNLHILKYENKSLIYTKKYNEVVYRSYSNSLFYSAKKHVITVDETDSNFNNDINIENSIIEENFIVGIENNLTNNDDKNMNSDIIQTVEDNFVAFK